MNYNITFEDSTARIDYVGEITNEDIHKAHSKLSSYSEFYQVKFLIINVADCKLDRVAVPGLLPAIAIDLGASLSVKSLKVAFVLDSFVNMERTSEYINKSNSLLSPWEWRHFSSEEHAKKWFESA